MADLGPPGGSIPLSQGVPEQLVPIQLVDATNRYTLETGVSSPTIQISKNGASWASANDGTWAEVGNGLYTVRLDDQDTDELGWLVLRVVKSGTSAEHQVLCTIGTSPDDDRESYNRIRRMQRSI